MKKLGSIIFLFLFIFGESKGQVISDNRLKDLLRIQYLLNDATTTDLQKSQLINPNQIHFSQIDSILAISRRKLHSNRNIQIDYLPLTMMGQATSILPNPTNLGNFLPARGRQFFLSGGLQATIGKHLQIQIAPEFLYAQNKDFDGFSQQLGNRAWVSRYQFWNTIDIPEQFGKGSVQQWLPGQSFIKYHWKNLTIGLSTQNLWWGPGKKNALIMSTNAPGFLHWSIGTNKSILTPIGQIETQMIGGKLSHTGIEPPRIHTVDNGRFVYEPKRNSTRYLTGMIVNWQPKWVPHLYLGMIQSAYFYAEDSKNPLDFLPLQMFYGNTTSIEKQDQKATMGSLFLRYLLPNDKAEIYVEYGRKDRALAPWQLLRPNSFRRAYVAGFQKLFEAPKQAHILFGLELTQMQAQSANFIRNPDSWYSHAYVREGYTHKGRTIGASIGPGSNSQSIEISWIKGLNSIGLHFERLRHNSDFYYYAFEYTSDYRRHWVDLSTSLQVDWKYKHCLLSGQVGMVRSYNYKWLIIQVDPNNFFVPGNEYLNLVGRFSIKYLW